jgi:propionyl-CoA carboxylase alpha chain
VGYPLLVKAAAGGGGRGMRLVLAEDDLEDSVAAARREAQDSFGDGTVFAEQWLAAPRHLEIQVVADKHGHVVHLGERECSIQRRHQKLIEEAPSPAVDTFLREQLGAAAVRLAESIDYDSIGTVEFLLDAERGNYFFLEMNTRLQVEHRVTEKVTGFDLLELQFNAAMGETFDFEQDEIDVEGYAIEARLIAEDPALDWLPSSGRLHRFTPPLEGGATWDIGYTTDAEVSPHFDSLLAKAIAFGGTRSEAAGQLARALVQTQIHGVTTNRDYLVAVLESDDFVDGNTTTAFVDLHLTLLDARPGAATLDAHVLAATLWAQEQRNNQDPHWSRAPSGWRNVGAARQHVHYRVHEDEIAVAYTVDPDGAFRADVDDRSFVGRWLATREDGAMLLEIGGYATTFEINHVGDRWFVNSAAGQSDLVEVPRFPSPTTAALAGGLAAPVPGRIVAVEVAIGDIVASGQTLVVMEAMKVEHRVAAPADGKVTDVLVAKGDNVDAHQVLIQMEPA